MSWRRLLAWLPLSIFCDHEGIVEVAAGAMFLRCIKCRRRTCGIQIERGTR